MVLNGDFEPVQAYIKFKEVSDHLKQLNEEIKENAFDMAEQYKSQNYMGYKLETSIRNTYSFEHIPAWLQLKEKMKVIEEEAKKIYFITKGADFIDSDSGEVKQSAQIKSIAKVITLKKAK
jgi:hypothetical protein